MAQFALLEHAVHVVDDAKKYPLTHAVQAVALVHVLQFAIFVEHFVHDDAPAAEKYPDAHAVHDAAPAAEYVFAPHVLHVDDAVAPVADEYLPAAHLVHED